MDFTRFRPELSLAGSPQRTLWRGVVESADGRLFVLEKIPTRVFSRKRQIAVTLHLLADYGLEQVLGYLPDIEGEVLSLINQGAWHGLWQLSPYVQGEPLDRPAYVVDGWRGNAAADFLIRFYQVCDRHGVEAKVPPFSIAAYISELFGVMQKRHPQIAARYRPFLDHLETHFFPIQSQLPARFCHGDFHPLNIIWGKSEIISVIDWEFCGVKPELYDLANLLGCLGIEDPGSLKEPFAERLIRQLEKAGIFAPASWRTLPDLMLAIRFAWLSEWLRNDDRAMIKMEAEYMTLLLEKRQAFQRRYRTN